MTNKKQIGISISIILVFIGIAFLVSAIDLSGYSKFFNQTSTVDTYDYGYSQYRSAFTFNVTTNDTNWNLEAINFYIRGAGGSENINISLHNITGDKKPNYLGDGGVIASVKTALTEPAVYGWINTTFPITELTTGQTYAIVIYWPDIGAGSHGLVGHTSDLYGGGQFWYSSDNGASWGTGGAAVLEGSFELYGSSSGAGSLETLLLYPVNNSEEEGDYVFFNISATPIIANITNATISIWNTSLDLVNQTTNLLAGEIINYSTWNISNFSLGQKYHWNVESCGINGSLDTICDWADINNSFTSSAFSVINYTFNSSTFETTRQSYVLNISGNTLVSSATAKLVYNGTSYTSVVTDGVAGYYRAINTLDVPLTDKDEDKTFYWQWSFTLTDGTNIKQNSTEYTQEVNRTWLAYCNTTAEFDTQFVNFTSKSAENPFPLVNATFKSAWSWWLGAGEVKRNISFEDITEGNHSFPFCMYPEHESFSGNAQIEFDGIDYSQNYYYLDDATLTNTTNNINLYLLNESLATLTVLQVYDESQSALEDVTLQIQLYDVGTDTYYLVGMAKTSFAGEDVVYLNWYDTLYKFILIKDGEVLKTTTPYKISETPQIFQIITSTVFTYDKFGDFVYNLYYNNITENFVLTFTKPSGLVDQGCLRVIKRSSINDTEICSVCETSSSATLYCNIGGYGNGTYLATFYATGSLKTFQTIVEFVGSVNEIYDLIGNTDGSAYAFLFAGIVVAMFFISPVVAIIGLILGLLGAIALGFQPINYLELLGISILGGVIIWLLKR